MKSEMSIEIDRPIEEVFDTASNRTVEWSTIVVEDEVLEETPEVVGSTFRLVTVDRGRRMEFEGVVTRYDPPKAHGILMRGDHFDIEAEYQFEDLGGRTRVTQHSVVHGKGFVKLMFVLFGWLMKKSSCNALETELNGLKRLCEAG